MMGENPSVDIGALVKIYKEAMKKGDNQRAELATSAIKMAAHAEAALAEARILQRVAIDV
jgi:hypothetical protein